MKIEKRVKLKASLDFKFSDFPHDKFYFVVIVFSLEP
ncbi:MAG: hypothetical protein ACI9WT_000294 [Flavobacterium sp.]|jgi:hypothetical protein